MTRIRKWLPKLALVAVSVMGAGATALAAEKPNILVIFGDDIGQTNISAYSMGVVGYKTPNIDRIAKEGMMFTDYYAENSCTAGRSSFITGQTPLRTGLSKVGAPGASVGLRIRSKFRRDHRRGRRELSREVVSVIEEGTQGVLQALDHAYEL